ncbi:MAG: outer membrane beta-barrel protein [Chloroflexi bacterium]|nr:outer membrane beta-barrel protein [Chloroflexota bacterium]
MLHFLLAHHRLALAASLAAAAATTSQLQALEASDLLIFSRDPVILRPQLDLSETYNDNVFFQHTNPVGDLVSTISPGLNIQIGKLEGNSFAVDYMFDNVFYAQKTEQNAQQHRLALRNKFALERLSIEGADQIEFLSSVLGGGISSLGLRVDRSVYDDNYTIRYEISPKTSVYIQGAHSAIDYQETIGLYDYNTLRGVAGFAYQGLPKTSFFGELYYGQTGTDPNGTLTIKPPHAEFIGGFLGARGSFTEKLSGTVKAGYEIREFSDGTPAPSLPVVEASVTQRLSEKTVLSLQYARRGYVSVQVLKQSYTADTADLSLVQWVGTTGKLRANLGAGYNLYQYERVGLSPERTDDSLTAYLNLTYDLRLWLKAYMGYYFESFRSDLPGVIDYDVNRVTLGLSIGY